jgi:hypothetical protein
MGTHPVLPESRLGRRPLEFQHAFQDIGTERGSATPWIAGVDKARFLIFGPPNQRSRWARFSRCTLLIRQSSTWESSIGSDSKSVSSISFETGSELTRIESDAFSAFALFSNQSKFIKMFHSLMVQHFQMFRRYLFSVYLRKIQLADFRIYDIVPLSVEPTDHLHGIFSLLYRQQTVKKIAHIRVDLFVYLLE